MTADTEREIVVTKKTTIQTFKARIKASRPHYVQKVITARTKVKDALEPYFCTYITTFVPKLKHRQQKPVAMCHISNGGGSCLFRCRSPTELATVLRQVADIVVSDEWLDKWEELCSISDRIIDNDEIFLDEQFVDTGDYKKKAGLEKKETAYPGLEVR